MQLGVRVPSDSEAEEGEPADPWRPESAESRTGYMKYRDAVFRSTTQARPQQRGEPRWVPKKSAGGKSSSGGNWKTSTGGNWKSGSWGSGSQEWQPKTKDSGWIDFKSKDSHWEDPKSHDSHWERGSQGSQSSSWHKHQKDKKSWDKKSSYKSGTSSASDFGWKSEKSKSTQYHQGNYSPSWKKQNW